MNRLPEQPSGSWYARILRSVEFFSSGLWTGESKEEQFEECAELSFHNITGLPDTVFSSQLAPRCAGTNPFGDLFRTVEEKVRASHTWILTSTFGVSFSIRVGRA